MQQRNSGYGRPSGTDGSDFSYRMVVDNRYKKVAQGKSRLSLLILAQATVQLLSVGSIFFSPAEGESFNRLAVSPVIIGCISLIVGESGRKRSRVNFLKFFIVGSSISFALSIGCFTTRNNMLEVLKNFSSGKASNLEILNTAAILLGAIVQILAISITVSLIHNMKPPTKAS